MTKINTNYSSSDITAIFNNAEELNTMTLKNYSIMKKIPLHITNENGNNLIHHILLLPDVKILDNQRLNFIKFLVNENVNPDEPNNKNQTPLHIACLKNFKGVVSYLVDLGVNINYKDDYGNIPLDYSLCHKMGKVSDFTPKSLITLPKKEDKVKIEEIYEIRQQLWPEIKESPFKDTS